MPPKRTLDTEEETGSDEVERPDKHVRVGSDGVDEEPVPEPEPAPALSKYIRFKGIMVQPSEHLEGYCGAFDFPLHRDQSDFMRVCSKLGRDVFLNANRHGTVTLYGCTCPKEEALRMEPEREALRMLHALLLAQASGVGGALRSLTLFSCEGEIAIVLGEDDHKGVTPFVQAKMDLQTHLATKKCNRCWIYPNLFVDLVAKYVSKQRKAGRAVFSFGAMDQTATPCLLTVIPVCYE